MLYLACCDAAHDCAFSFQYAVKYRIVVAACKPTLGPLMLQMQHVSMHNYNCVRPATSRHRLRILCLWIAAVGITMLAACGGGGGDSAAATATDPAAPTGISVTAGNDEATIAWVAVTGATSYNIYRSTTQGSLGSKIGSSSTVTFTDSSAVNGTSYYYEVTAVNAAGEGAASMQSAAVTPTVPVVAPTAPTGVNATAGNAQVTVIWTAVTGATSYNVYRSTTQGSLGNKIGSSSTVTFTDSSAVNGTSYYYEVTAVNAAGEGAASMQSAAATPTVPVVVPTAPTGVNATSGNAQVTVTWAAVTVATSYNIYRSTTQGSLGTKIGSSSTVTFTDSSAVNGTSYYYEVTAVNAAGEGAASMQSAAATPTVPVVVPTAPTGVNATSGNAQVTVTWAAVTVATSYNIYRSTTQGSLGTKIGSSSTVTFTDSSAINGTTYYYEVTAVNSAGEGPASSPGSVTFSIGWTTVKMGGRRVRPWRCLPPDRGQSALCPDGCRRRVPLGQ
jgi:fibronectin type 3 domain-containing protein